MGTRADFYVGRGRDAEWLGSIAWDGYIDGIDKNILYCSDESGFRRRVTAFIAKRDDGTKPSDGWPWPWNDSSTTDFTYAFDDGQVWYSIFGSPWLPHDVPEPDDGCEYEKVEFPDMSARQNVTLGKRSGIIIIESKEPPEGH